MLYNSDTNEFAIRYISPRRGPRAFVDRSPVVQVSLVVDQMTRCRLLYLLLLAALMISIEAAKGGGGRGRGRGRGRVFGSRMHILIPNRNPASTHYYENKDVSWQGCASVYLVRVTS